MYFITVFEKLPTIGGFDDCGFQSCVGYFEKFEDAEDVVLNNYSDIYESIYNYAVIEYIEEGINHMSHERWFYKYNEDEDGYLQIDKPEVFENVYNFAIG